MRLTYIAAILAHRGASPETVPLAEQGVAFRARRLVTAFREARTAGLSPMGRQASDRRPTCRCKPAGAIGRNTCQKPPRWSAGRRGAPRNGAQERTDYSAP